MTTSLERFRAIIGQERAVTGITQALHFLVSGMQPRTVGAMHVTCADESERECAQAFQQGFVQAFLPSLSLGHRAAFRLANLGGAYEWGAVRIAERHYATETGQEPLLLVIKVNSHVGIHVDLDGTTRFGVLRRYDRESACCGALAAVLGESSDPFAERLGDALRSEAGDRIAALGEIDADQRALFAALASARLQARQAVLDIQDHEPVSPTRYVVVPCVTINRLSEPDTEIVCGVYSGDRDTLEYFGLGDDPREFSIRIENRRLIVTDPKLGASRPARDHRELLMHRWRELRHASSNDARLAELRAEVASNRHRLGDSAKPLLLTLLKVMAELTPVSSAIMMVAHGAAGMHNAFTAHRLADDLASSDEALRILAETRRSVEGLEPRQAQALLEHLLRDYAS